MWARRAAQASAAGPVAPFRSRPRASIDSGTPRRSWRPSESRMSSRSSTCSPAARSRSTQPAGDSSRSTDEVGRVLVSAQVSLGERASGPRLQIAGEFERSCLLAKRDDHVELPRTVPCRVNAFARVVRIQTRPHVVGHASVVPFAIAEASEHIDESFLSDHDAAMRNLCAGANCQRSRGVGGVVIQKASTMVDANHPLVTR
jgi:hypothetical protein